MPAIYATICPTNHSALIATYNNPDTATVAPAKLSTVVAAISTAEQATLFFAIDPAFSATN